MTNHFTAKLGKKNIDKLVGAVYGSGDQEYFLLEGANRYYAWAAGEYGAQLSRTQRLGTDL